jgi:ArpU family phage transcriptional regulator
MNRKLHKGRMKMVKKINEKEVQRLVAGLLKQYKAYRVALANKAEQDTEGLVQLFPSLEDNYSQKYIVVKQIERAIEYALDEREREIIKRKYLDKTRVKDVEVFMGMGISKDQYYNYKKDAINLIANALGII